MTYLRAGPVAALLAALALANTARATPPDPRLDLPGFLEHVVALACPAPTEGGALLGDRLGAAALLESGDEGARPGSFEWRFRLVSKDEVRVIRLAPGGRLRQLAVELYQTIGRDRTRPRAVALADEDCAIELGRRIDYDLDGSPTALVMLDSDLVETGKREPLEPPVPAGTDPGGVRVALIDSGVNYTLPMIASRLARDPAGGGLGYDFWDLDPRPFDGDSHRSPFFPQRHGTAVASILIREAPTASLVPYRYPRPDLDRFADLIADAAAKKVRVVNMALGSRRRADWNAFLEAARAHPELLFVVSAGNNGRSIEDDPVYPAALALDNMLVVTSSDRFGHLAPGSNWGPQHVDLMVFGEQQPVIDFKGNLGHASGSSFAVPRVSALAVRLLASHPDW
ncbi:MAG: S8 family peptidase, partial [Geminicoccaceae bacterium]